MKLASREARAHLRRPDPRMAATLVTGEDGARVAEARAGLVRALVGEAGEAEMRLERLSGAELRRDGSLLVDALKAQGFFPGPRAVLLEEATDGLAPVVAAALEAWREGDARLVVTGTGLPARGALRRLFEAAPRAAAVTLYDDPPEEEEVVATLRAAGLTRFGEGAREDLMALARGLEPGEFRGLVERLSLHEAGAEGPLSAATVAALAPQAEGAEMDDLLAAVSDRRRAEVPPLLSRVLAEGAAPVAVAIAALRHWRALLALLSDPGGPGVAVGRLRPPVGGARRQALLRAAGGWSQAQAAEALQALVSLDLALRSGGALPAAAALERVLIRLATGRGQG